MQKLHKPVSFTVFRTILRNCGEDSLGMAAEHCKLYEISGIEQDICIFLIRVYPFDFSPSDIRPVGNGFLSSKRAFVEIAYDTPEESVVTGRDAVVVIQRNTCNSIDEYSEFGRIRNIVQKSWIQGMEAFYQKYRPFLQSQTFTVIFSDTCNEVILRNFHGLSGNEFQDIFLKGYMIHSVEIIEIV